MGDVICSVDGCGKPHEARGYCTGHYSNWARNGTPVRTCETCGAPVTRSRFCSKACWPLCAFEGCRNQIHRGSGTLCGTHRSQLAKTGSLRAVTRTWAAPGGLCAICSEPVPQGSGRRKHCSDACRAADSRHASQRPESMVCALCGREVTLRQRDKSGRLIRTDTVWCWECGRQSPEAIRFKRYGITPAEYTAALAKGCEICGAKKASLHVDHDHSCCPPSKYRTCGKCVRGMICGSCNRALGLFKDNPETLRSAVSYLERTRGALPL